MEENKDFENALHQSFDENLSLEELSSLEGGKEESDQQINAVANCATNNCKDGNCAAGCGK